MPKPKSPQPMQTQRTSNPDTEPYIVSSVESDAKLGARRRNSSVSSQTATRLRKQSLKVQKERQQRTRAARKRT